MFILGNNNNLVFLKSNKVNVYPCGRRRARLIDTSNDNKTDGYIPFDPEARLNTESNNRKHSGLNGYKQDYIYSFKNNDKFVISICGYLFTIDTSDINSVNDFGNILSETFNTSEQAVTEIYANAKLADIQFFEGNPAQSFPAAATTVLRDQAFNGDPETCLDLLIASNYDRNNLENYYFSGLSFSTAPEKNTTSLCIMKKTENGWILCNESRLPKIEHGSEDDSIVVGNIKVTGNITAAGAITADQLIQGSHRTLTLDVVPITGTEPSKSEYQLKFTGSGNINS